MPYYSSDSPQVRAGKASGEARRRRAAEARWRKARLAWFSAHPGEPGHPLNCVCAPCAHRRGDAIPPELSDFERS